MPMTKRDYHLVATAIMEQRVRYKQQYHLESKAMDDFAETMAAHFVLLNDNFKQDVFLKAAGHGTSGNDRL